MYRKHAIPHPYDTPWHPPLTAAIRVSPGTHALSGGMSPGKYHSTSFSIPHFLPWSFVSLLSSSPSPFSYRLFSFPRHVPMPYALPLLPSPRSSIPSLVEMSGFQATNVAFSSHQAKPPLPDQMLPYSSHSLYPPIPYATEEVGPAPGALTPSDVSSSISPPNGQLGNNKYSTSISGDRIASALTQEDQSRRSAEEDRRRRNTAASARFRMKKKQREQTLERTVRETTERNASLEARVAQLEMENRWLKNLVTEKHEVSTSRLAMPPEDSREMARRVNSIPGSGQKHIQPKKGVGTKH